MRYSCTVNGEQFVVNVELGSERIRATVSSVEPEVAILSVYNATIDTSRGYPDPDVFGEHVARDAFAHFEGEVDPSAPITAYTLAMTRLN